MPIMPNKFENKYGEYGLTAAVSTVALLVLFIALLFLASRTGNVVVNHLVIILGAACGWAIGIFYSPYNEKEEGKFSEIGKTISVFVSGYVLSKFDRFLEKTLFDETKEPVFDIWMRLGFFASSMILIALVVFANRAYFRTTPSKSNTTKEEQSGAGGTTGSESTAQ